MTVTVSLFAYFLIGMAIFLAGLAADVFVQIPSRPQKPMRELAVTLNGGETLAELAAKCKAKNSSSIGNNHLARYRMPKSMRQIMRDIASGKLEPEPEQVAKTLGAAKISEKFLDELEPLIEKFRDEYQGSQAAFMAVFTALMARLAEFAIVIRMPPKDLAAFAEKALLDMQAAHNARACDCPVCTASRK